MTSHRSPQSIASAPSYAKHRENVTAVDSDFTDKALGINCQGCAVAHVQVVPATGATVTVEVRFWSEATGAFVATNDPVTKNSGVGVSFEFDVDVGGRIMLVAVNAIDTAHVDVYVSGSPLL